MDDCQLLQEFVKNGSEPSFRELVARHLNLVYSSALRQVTDRQMAEEVTQAVFILLARKAARLSSGVMLPGWLFRTTRFVASRALRAESRRRLREQKAFDMQSTLTPDDSWKQIAPALDEALAKLGETDRNVLLLRFFENQSHAQVGTALGLSEDAARKRTDRALDKLWGGFASRGFTLTAAGFASVLLAHATNAAPAALLNNVTVAALKFSAAATPALPSLAGQTIHSWRLAKLKWAGAVTGFVALLTTLMVALTSQKQSVSTAFPTTRPAASTLTVTAPAIEPPKDSRVTAVTPAAAPGTTNVLHFHAVARDTGEPVPYAKLAVLTVTAGEWDTRYDLETDATGSCNIPLLEGLGRLDVGVVSSGWGARCATWYADKDSFPSEYTLRLERVTNSIGGWLRDEAGNAIANAQVWIQFGGGGDAFWRETPRERDGSVDYVPVAISDRDGHWSCAVIPTQNPGYSLVARLPDFPPADIVSFYPNLRQPDTNPKKLEQLWAGKLVTIISHGVTLMGTVTDSAGQPLANAEVHHNPESTDSLSVTADSDGRFSIPNLNTGRFDFAVTAKGFSPEYRDVDVKPGLATQEIHLQTGALLLVRVVDKEGLTVPDATVGLENWGEHPHSLDWKAQTDSQGRIEWNSAPATETLELYAYKNGWCYTRQIEVKADGQEHTIILQRALRLSGRVVDEKSGDPVSTFRVFPGYGEGSGEFVWARSSTRYGTNGDFTLEFAETRQPWRVTVEAEGYQPLISNEIPPELSQTLLLAMKPADAAKAIRGVVLLPDGKPAAGVQVAKLTLDYRVSLGNAKLSDPGVGLLTNTDAAGNFYFAFDPRAHSVAAASPEGFAKSRVYDSTKPVTLRLQAWGRIEGTVAETELSRPMEYVVLMDDPAMNYEGSVTLDINTFNAKADASGKFVFEKAPPGVFSLYINRGMGIPFSCRTTVTVNEGQTSVVQIGGKGISVTGHLTSANQVTNWSKYVTYATLSDNSKGPQSSLEGDAAAIWAVDFWQSKEGIEYYEKDHSFSLIVAADGSFRAEDVEPGDYKLRVYAQRTSLEKDVNLPPGSGDVDLGSFELRAPE